ncbi:SRPBCC family protein [Novosphingobium sp.]|uniref:SRPBCC family protein n=1 Tax=Novosphingobium sp. TaxID=1874826 RepID=UPI003D0D1C24
MYALSYAIPVNPEGVTPKLTQAQVWAGLVMKVDDAKPFVNGMSQCDVLERTDDTVTRVVTFRGSQHKEHITLFAPIKVHFHRPDGSGWIDNTISESDAGLLLTFTFGINFPGIAAGSPEETAQGEAMRGAYIGAVAATLAYTRELAAAGEL